MEGQADKNKDILNMDNYRVEKLPKIEKSGFEKIMMKVGIPLSDYIIHSYLSSGLICLSSIILI